MHALLSKGFDKQCSTSLLPLPTPFPNPPLPSCLHPLLHLPFPDLLPPDDLSEAFWLLPHLLTLYLPLSLPSLQVLPPGEFPPLLPAFPHLRQPFKLRFHRADVLPTTVFTTIITFIITIINITSLPPSITPRPSPSPLLFHLLHHLLFVPLSTIPAHFPPLTPGHDGRPPSPPGQRGHHRKRVQCLAPSDLRVSLAVTTTSLGLHPPSSDRRVRKPFQSPVMRPHASRPLPPQSCSPPLRKMALPTTTIRLLPSLSSPLENLLP